MTVAISTDDAQSGWLKVHILGNAVAAGPLGEIANPEGVLVHICKGFLHIVTGAALASTLHMGIGATGSDSHEMIDGFGLNQLADTVWFVVGQDLASEGAAVAPRGTLWPAASFLTLTTAAQVSTGLEANLYLEYIRLA